MPAFICCKCGCVDNTACQGTYYRTLGNRHKRIFKDQWYDTHPVCSSCNNIELLDGTIYGNGEWHNIFEKKHWSKYGTIEKILAENGLINAKEYFIEQGLMKGENKDGE